MELQVPLQSAGHISVLLGGGQPLHHAGGRQGRGGEGEINEAWAGAGAGRGTGASGERARQIRAEQGKARRGCGMPGQGCGQGQEC